MSLPSLNLPTQDLSSKPRPYIRSKDLLSWAEELPYADPAASAAKFIDRVELLNRSMYPDVERQELLLTLDPILAQLAQNLRYTLNNFTVPLDSRMQIHASLLRKCYEAMASGYKIIFSEHAMDRRPGLVNETLMLESMYYAVHYLSKQLHTAYTLYNPEPKGVWAEIHQIYSFALLHDYQYEVIDDQVTNSNSATENTLDKLYKQILLLVTTNPYHLMQFEIEEITPLLAEWTEHCQLLPADALSTVNEYVVDLGSDRGPQFIAPDINTTFIDPRIIDLADVNKQLDSHLKTVIGNSTADFELERPPLQEWQMRDTLLRLSDAWKIPPLRNVPRYELNAEVLMSVGLNATHHFISNKPQFTPAMDELRFSTSEQERSSKVFIYAYREALEKDKRYTYKGFTLNPWHQCNVSPMGIALQCSMSCHLMQARVGELVSYRFTSKKDSRWHLGVIRWLKSKPSKAADEILDIGVMNLAKKVFPVAIRRTKSIDGHSPYHRAMFIPNQVSLNQTRSLLIPAYTFDVGAELTMTINETVLKIKLTRLLRTTRAFAQFDFSLQDSDAHLPE